MGVASLPKRYIKPLEKRDKIGLKKDHVDVSISVIDMSNLDEKEMETLICNAAEKWGFFEIINHGIPLKVLEDVKVATYCQSQGTVKLHRTYILTLIFSLNVKDELLEYIKSSEVVTKHLVKVLMKGLKIHEINEKKESLLMGSKRINLNYYPKCPKPELAIGVGRHSDISKLTILLQNDVGGLYVRGINGESWVHVPPIKGALIINVGDALQILSNGKYKSVEHLVVGNGLRNRVSIPIFVGPTPNSIIAPLQDMLNEEEEHNKPIYKEVLYLDYVKHFHQKAHDGKATIEFAKISNTN
ncbi:F6'H1: Feruloyl CoA ortho-hydroxylase 1 [Bienertia sinuspersici]